MEKPTFNLQDADKISDKEFAKYLDNGTRFLGNLSAWKSQNEKRWASIREIRQAKNSVGESREERAERHQREAVMHPQETTLAPEVQSAMQEFDRDKCVEMIKGNGADRLRVVDPLAWERLRIAARGHGIIGGELPARPKPPQTEGRTTHEWVEHFLGKTAKH